MMRTVDPSELRQVLTIDFQFFATKKTGGNAKPPIVSALSSYGQEKLEKIRFEVFLIALRE
jgi:hypothetical protein